MSTEDPSDYPEDRTGDQLRRMAAGGVEMEAPRVVSFAHVISDPSAATEMARAAADLGYEVSEGWYPRGEMAAADEVFSSSSVKWISMLLSASSVRRKIPRITAESSTTMTRSAPVGAGDAESWFVAGSAIK